MTRLLLKLCCSFILFISMQTSVFAGVVFTIDSTDKQTGESLGSMEVVVEGELLKMTFLDSGSKRDRTTRGIEHIPEMTIVDEASSALDDSGAVSKSGKNIDIAKQMQNFGLGNPNPGSGGNVLGSMKDMAIAQMKAQLNAGTITTEQYQASLKMINQTFKPVKRTWGKDIDRSKIKRPKTIRQSSTAKATGTAVDAAAMTVTESTSDSAKEVITNTTPDTSSTNAQNNSSASDDATIITNANQNANDGEMIFNSTLKKMVVVDHETKSYFPIDESFMTNKKGNFGGVAGQMGAVGGMMQQAYEAALAQLDAQGLSPEERTAAEQMLRNTFGIESMPSSKGSSQLEIVEGNTSKIKIGGKNYTAKAVKVFRGKIIEKELMVVDFKQLIKNARERKTLKDYFDFLSKMSSIKGQKDSNIFSEMGSIDGFPVVTRDFEGGELDEETKLESVIERDLDPDAFEPPSGYKRRTMGGFFQ